MWTLAPSVSFDADAVLIIIGSSWLPTADAVRVGLLYPGTRVQNCPEEQKEESRLKGGPYHSFLSYISWSFQ